MAEVRMRGLRVWVEESDGRLWVTVRQVSARTGRVYGRVYFRASEPASNPGWIATLQKAMSGGEPLGAIWDYLRDHGYGY